MRKHSALLSANAALFHTKGRLSWKHVNSPQALIAHPDALALDLQATNGLEAVRALHASLGTANGAVLDQKQFLADIVERMGIATVCIADEIALPHARTAAVSRLVLGIGRMTSDVTFDTEHPRVRLVFLIGTPKEAVTDYLQLVAALSRLLKNAATRAALLAAPSEAGFRALLSRGIKR